jgi:hypothetical protein
MTAIQAQNLKIGQIITFKDRHIDYYLVVENHSGVELRCLWYKDEPKYVNRIYTVFHNELQEYIVVDEEEVKSELL